MFGAKSRLMSKIHKHPEEGKMPCLNFALGESDFEVGFEVCVSVHWEYMRQNILSRGKNLCQGTEPKQCGVVRNYHSEVYSREGLRDNTAFQINSTQLCQLPLQRPRPII